MLQNCCYVIKNSMCSHTKEDPVCSFDFSARFVWSKNLPESGNVGRFSLAPAAGKRSRSEVTQQAVRFFSDEKNVVIGGTG